MTSIVCWFEKNENCEIWVVGDSKISETKKFASSSNNDEVTYTMLLESGAKIFSIPLICKTIDANGFFEKIFLETKIGLAYAGSSLIGLNVQAALTTIFSSLINTSGIPPSIDSLADYASMIIKSYINTLAVMKPDSALCEFLIMGYCNQTNDYKVCHLSPDFSSGKFDLSIEITSSKNSNNDFLVLLGDKKDEITSSVKTYKKQNPSKTRAPKHVLQEIIQNEIYPSIGGHIQLGICHNGDFNVYSTCLPITGTPKAYLSYLGFDVSGDASRVGNCMVGIKGMV